MAVKLQVIALISGGKDSFFSIQHCLQNGHEIVALANLHPPETDSAVSDDIESYMYQTVGHNLIPLYSSALDLPLYRQPISGSAVNTSKSYSKIINDKANVPDNGIETDETEALVPLLHRILSVHSSANAISTGAILSDYQRTRVESVAIRLGLVPLSYLWQYPFLPPYTQTSLLEDISAAGQDSRIIKVASGGLGEEHLWLNVGEQKSVSKLIRSMSRFGGLQGGAVLGEGGEFETITLDGPAPLWKGRIEIEEDDRTVVMGSGGSCALRIAKAKVVDKTYEGLQADGVRVRIPELFDDEFATLLEHLGTKNVKTVEHPASAEQSTSKQPFMDGCIGSNSSVSICNLTGVEKGDAALSADVQMERLKYKITDSLDTHSLTLEDISSTTILLRSMADFATVNKTYGAMFTQPNPPARITISCGDTLPDKVLVAVSLTANRCNSSDRRGLHVQSRSYWAPANIGPYSQAIAVPLRTDSGERGNTELVYVAGQIPLSPATMEIVSEDFEVQTVLALQHLWRIGRAMNVGWWSSTVAFLTASSVEQAHERAILASEAWRMIHEKTKSLDDSEGDDESADEDIGYKHLRQPWTMNGKQSGDVTTHRWPLPNWEQLDDNYHLDNDAAAVVQPHCVVVQVDELPRGAQIEWTSFSVSGASHMSVTEHAGIGVCMVSDAEYCVKCVDIVNAEHFEAFVEELSQQLGDLLEVYTPHTLPAVMLQKAQVMHVPCRSVWSSSGQKLYAAIRIRGHCQKR